MPFHAPFRDRYQAGDMIFGYAQSITAFIDQHRAEGANDSAKVNALTTDVADANHARYARGVPAGETPRAVQFVTSLSTHAKYNRVVSADENAGQTSWITQNRAMGPARNNQSWRMKSKGALYWATMEAGIHIHFVLDSIPIADVVGKNHQSPHAHAADTPSGRKATAPEEATKTRTVTHAELRWIYRNRGVPAVAAHIQFWLNNACCDPPWETDAALWLHYVPTVVA